ncbi:hypothetical protein Mapa_014486 [Marchantia paleacea]|nr:hypothetical protein Mapa_014486 [Marchantia paleacea]
MATLEGVDRRTLLEEREKWNFYTIGMLIVAIAIPVGIGFLGTTFGGGGESEWYKSLDKPSWTPPGYVFPIMWTTLYVLMGIASFLVWKEGGFRAQAYPLAVYALQLVLNLAWTPLFFGLHRPDYALGEIIVLWLAIAGTIYMFFQVNHVAAYLLIPYILWVTVATALNAYIYMHNPILSGDAYHDITTPLRGPNSA